jgi:maltose alpha-D-glucosyltransferase/alpha-amylase
VWSDEEPADRCHGMVFPGPQQESWTFDETAGAWYRHRFYEFEPDLNTDHPDVRREIFKIAEFWAATGRLRIPARCCTVPHRDGRAWRP